jgi:hypothetical protein
MELFQKKTIDKLVDEMVENGIIEVKKDKENSRNHKLYLKVDNPMVFVHLQLNEFGSAFENLLYYIIQNIIKIRTNQFSYQSEDRSKMDDANFSSLLQCINILDKMSYVYMAYSTIDWPKKIQDEEILRKLFSIVFSKIADLRYIYQKYLCKHSQKYIHK